MLNFSISLLSLKLGRKALVEILLLSGGTPYANFRALAHAWGRERGFHNLLASNICERRGDIERKKRSDAGRVLTSEQKETFKQKLRKTRHYKTDSGLKHPEDLMVDDGDSTTEPSADLLHAPSVEEMVDEDVQVQSV